MHRSVSETDFGIRRTFKRKERRKPAFFENGEPKMGESETKPPRPAAEMTFEEALDELEELTASMASGQMSLRESVSAYERGTQLLKRCRSELSDARATIERLRAEETGAAEAQSGDVPW